MWEFQGMWDDDESWLIDVFCLKNLYEKSLYEIVFLRRERSTISRIFFVLFFVFLKRYENDVRMLLDDDFR